MVSLTYPKRKAMGCELTDKWLLAVQVHDIKRGDYASDTTDGYLGYNVRTWRTSVVQI